MDFVPLISPTLLKLDGVQFVSAFSLRPHNVSQSLYIGRLERYEVLQMKCLGTFQKITLFLGDEVEAFPTNTYMNHPAISFYGHSQ